MKPSSKTPSPAPKRDQGKDPDRTGFEATREQIERQNDRNTSADETGRSPKSNKLSGSGINVAGPGGK
ncbi:MAG: hypothetical protein QHC78_16675 [Pigmentiphaga sp.]|uniref:hypothetical protein n=1 Tax=Pigmentiphaga sp. TaxID=1977564 RepID=UPI0029B4AB8C|nr:hypothetical protein [Pigmentiphaga sp.]MDX3907326.1 hypothetical protein [Pigmentiphaga sp.]